MGPFVERFVILLLGAACFATSQVSEAAEVDELSERLTSLETNQIALRETLQNFEQEYSRDVDNVTLFCQGLQVRVEKQREALESLQDSLGNNGNQQPDQPDQPDQLEGPCNSENHRVLDDAWRSTSEELDYGDENQCDDELPHGWYRFLLHGENAVMPTSCVEDNHCQTHAPQWLDLQGKSLPEVGQEVRARACAHWSSDCCNWESPITVRNCGAYFVYYLEPRDTCNLAYCAEPQV